MPKRLLVQYDAALPLDCVDVHVHHNVHFCKRRGSDNVVVRLQLPPALLAPTDRIQVDEWVHNLLMNTMTNRMQVSDSMGAVFLFFLGAQGKEYIGDIRRKFPANFLSVVFVSSNIGNRFDDCYCVDAAPGAQLTNYFHLVDPLGGGLYPLDYMVILDSQLQVRSRVPVRIGPRYHGYQKFGTSLAELDALINEALTHIS